KTNKKSTKTTDVKNYNELVGALNQAVNDTDHTEYVINLNNGTYTSTVNYDYDYWPNATNDVNIIINANNQSIKTVATQSTQALGVQVNEKYNLTINNLKIEGKLTFYGNTTIQNSIINETITNYGTLYIDNNTVIGKNARINGNGKIVINDMDRIINKLSFLNGTYTIVNKSVGVIENHGNITLINCTLSSVKENTINNYGNITLINSKILQNTSTFYVNNYNESNMKLINSSAVFTMYNYGVLVISDDSTIENGSYFLTNDNGVIINNTNRIVHFFNFITGNYTFNKITFQSGITFLGNIICNNCNLKGIATNRGNLTVKNCTVNSITNYNNANLTVNDSTVTYVYCFANSNTTITNSTIKYLTIYSDADCTLVDVKLTSAMYLYTRGTLYIEGSIEFGNDFVLDDSGQIVIDDASKLFNAMNTQLNADYI
ncbi:MAG: hypothetical protein BZ136_08705, partial [Methanosphaera sp. rholeuAM74]